MATASISTTKGELEARNYTLGNAASFVIEDSFGAKPLSSLSSVMNQSFLQGTNGLLKLTSSAFDSKDGSTEREFEKVTSNFFRAASSVALPNTLSSFYKAERAYMPDTRVTKDMSMSDRIFTSFMYTVNDKMFGSLREVPLKVDWKGEPIKQTPEGSDPISFNVFPFLKVRQGSGDPLALEIKRIYDKTNEVSNLIGYPTFTQKKAINVSQYKKLWKYIPRKYNWVRDEEFAETSVFFNTTEINDLMSVLGKERYNEALVLYNSESYKKKSPMVRLEALNKVNNRFNSMMEVTPQGRLRDHSLLALEIMQKKYEEWKEGTNENQ
jgi:hypothetical protein